MQTFHFTRSFSLFSIFLCALFLCSCSRDAPQKTLAGDDVPPTPTRRQQLEKSFPEDKRDQERERMGKAFGKRLEFPLGGLTPNQDVKAAQAQTQKRWSQDPIKETDPAYKRKLDALDAAYAEESSRLQYLYKRKQIEKR